MWWRPSRRALIREASQPQLAQVLATETFTRTTEMFSGIGHQGPEQRAPADSEHGCQSTHRLALLVQAQKSRLLGHTQFHRLGGGQATCDPGLAGGGAALPTKFEFQLGDRGHDAGDGAPRRSAGVHAFPQGPHVDATAGQLDVYADLFDDDLDSVAVRLDTAIKSAADSLRTKSVH